MSKLVIGVCGGSASGKTSICRDIIERLSHHRVNIISQDNFYKPLDQSINTDTYNFDHPDAIDFIAFHSAIDSLKKGVSTEIPIYDFKTHNRLKDKVHTIPESSIYSLCKICNEHDTCLFIVEPRRFPFLIQYLHILSLPFIGLILYTIIAIFGSGNITNTNPLLGLKRIVSVPFFMTMDHIIGASRRYSVKEIETI